MQSNKVTERRRSGRKKRMGKISSFFFHIACISIDIILVYGNAEHFFTLILMGNCFLPFDFIIKISKRMTYN